MIKSLEHIIKAYWRGFAYGVDFNHYLTEAAHSVRLIEK